MKSDKFVLLPPTPQDLQRPGAVLLESQLQDRHNRLSWFFTNPVGVISCTRYGEVAEALREVQSAVRGGLFAAGFISYEAGLALVPRQEQRPPDSFPLLRFGLYEKASSWTGPLSLPGSVGTHRPFEHATDMGYGAYMDGVRRILRLIGQGETYQVNFTARLRYRTHQDPLNAYLRLRRSHPVPFGAFAAWDDFSIVSMSPEMFLRKRGPVLWTRPMKGTAPRGTCPDTDRRNARRLREDEKVRAENLMIVDLMRNDLGQVCLPGTVSVFEPFQVEPYGSLFQLTTGVKGHLREGATLLDILKATFPPGSVTGAPKVRTMQIIGELEPTPRRVYTGCIGAFFPDGDFVLSVAIRTVIAWPDGRCELGIGSGIVADSDPEGELKETLLKARFLQAEDADCLMLFETILLDENGCLSLLEEHLERMGRSAARLGFPCCLPSAARTLEEGLRGVEGPAAVRLLLSPGGEFKLDVSVLRGLPPGPFRVLVSPVFTDSRSFLLGHKTTERALYDRELDLARNEGFSEVLFFNEEGCLTEGAFTNVFVLRDGSWITPSLACGLLPGIWRQKQLQSLGAAEGRLTLSDLSGAQRVVLGNSVRGSLEVGEILSPDGTKVFPSRA